MSDSSIIDKNDESREVSHLLSAEFNGLRLDQALPKLYPDRSRGYFQKVIRKGGVWLNGKRRQVRATVKEGDIIRIVWPPDKTYDVTAQEVSFGIIFEDDDILIVNKPPKVVVHPSDTALSGTLVHGLLHYDHETFAPMVDANMRPGIVHRLDANTSGAMVVAKNMKAWNFLKKAFKDRHVEKTYIALAIGEFANPTGTIENNIGRHPVNRLKMAVVPEGGKHALTKYRVLATNGEFSLLEVRIFTGRTHQIRVHFSHLHHPLLGDHVYGGCGAHLSISAPRQMLHAWRLIIPHPASGVMRQYTAPLPDDFCQVLENLGLPVVGKFRNLISPGLTDGSPEISQEKLSEDDD